MLDSRTSRGAFSSDMFEYSTLANGMRIVTATLGHTPAEMCGVAVNAGSRDEAPGEHGLAHFVEHTLFKGTSRRRACHINNRMEAVGGELNAYTTKEETFLYSTFPAGGGYLDRAAELIADLVTNSQFPEAEIERERQVVLDEIMSYRDVPSEAVFDDFDDLIYAGSPVGHNILGTEQSVAALSPAACRRWISTLYTPGQMVFFYTGPLPHARVASVAQKRFGMLHHPDIPRRRTAPATVAPFDEVRNIGAHQAHTIVGARTGGIAAPDRSALALAINVIGGPGMNSLLNIALREKRGLVYSIEASSALLTDAGLMTVYFGCDPSDTQRCRRLTADILSRMANEGLTPRRLEAAKRQLLGQLMVAGAQQDNVILAAARATLHLGRATEPSETAERIRAVTTDSFRLAASLFLPSLTSTLTLL